MKLIKPVPEIFLIDQVTGKSGLAELIAFPENAQDTADFLKDASKQGKKVITIGSGTGLVGALQSKAGHYLLSTEKINKIISIDEETLTLTVESGVTLAEIRDFLAETPYFYAPDPGSKEATIGGNAATNAGGMRAIKYGVTRDNIRGIEVVLSDGRILQLGGLNNKSSSGFDLKDLFIGSEGTLGVITRLQLKIRPRPLQERHMLIGFKDLKDLSPVIFQILASPITPTALEFVEKAGFSYGAKVVDATLPAIAGEFFLLLTVDGTVVADLEQELAVIEVMALEAGAVSTRLIAGQEAIDTWLLRDHIVLGVKATSVYEPYDLVVPVNQIATAILRLQELAGIHLVEAVFFGHAGDGNIHLTVLKGAIAEQQWVERLANYNEAVYQVIHELGGLPSAEHGIGTMKKQYLLNTLGEDHIKLMRQVKLAIDPTNTLNPGKIVDL